MILNTVCLIIAFLVGFLGYRKAFKDGLDVKEGKDISPIKIDFKTPNISLKEDTKPDLIREGVENILAYTGEPQKKER